MWHWENFSTGDKTTIKNREQQQLQTNKQTNKQKTLKNRKNKDCMIQNKWFHSSHS